MADIKLKNANGEEISYLGVNSLSVPSVDGGRVNFSLTPSGKIEIKNTQETDVSAYATAQVVDSNLKAENIAKDVTVLGITGTHQGGIIPSGKKTITDTSEVDVAQFATAQVVDVNLKAENIITGRSILGVAGSAVVPAGTITTTPKVTSQTIDVTNYAASTVNPIFEEISTEAGMDAVCVDANIGKMYKYTGTSSKYSQNSLYIVNTMPVLTFHIDGVQYNAEFDQNWEMWCDSAYNIGGKYHIDDNAHISSKANNIVYNQYGFPVTNTEPIYEYMYYERTELKTVTIDGTGVTYESGMNWGNWVSSAYNTIGLSRVFDGATGDHVIANASTNKILKSNSSNDAVIVASTVINDATTFITATYTPTELVMINGERLTTLKNMTWASWVSSAYNTISMSIGAELGSEKRDCLRVIDEATSTALLNNAFTALIHSTDIVTDSSNIALDTSPSGYTYNYYSYNWQWVNSFNLTIGDSVYTYLYNNGSWRDLVSDAALNIDGFALDSAETKVTVLINSKTYQIKNSDTTVMPDDPISNTTYTGQEVVAVKLIINGKEYKTDEGLTWENWVSSEYNTGNYFIKHLGTPGVMYTTQYIWLQETESSSVYINNYGGYGPLESTASTTDSSFWDEYQQAYVFYHSGNCYTFYLEPSFGQDEYMYISNQEGYTWADWVNSSCNVDGWAADTATGHVKNGWEGSEVLCVNEGGMPGTPIKLNDYIGSEASNHLIFGEAPSEYTFTVDGTPYEFDEATNVWDNWLNSTYNQGYFNRGIEPEDNYVYEASTGYKLYIMAPGDYVYTYTTIEQNATYYTEK